MSPWPRAAWYALGDHGARSVSSRHFRPSADDQTSLRGIVSGFQADRPFNDLPALLPTIDLETKVVLKQCVTSRAALAELDGKEYEMAGFVWQQGWNDMCKINIKESIILYPTYLVGGVFPGVQFELFKA